MKINIILHKKDIRSISFKNHNEKNHAGWDYTLYFIKEESYIWNNIISNIDVYIKKYIVCNKFKSNNIKSEKLKVKTILSKGLRDRYVAVLRDLPKEWT